MQRVVVLAIVTACVAFAAADAAAVAPSAKLGTVVEPNVESLTASYTFTRYKTDKNEYCTGFSITFPAGTDVSLATCPDGTVAVAGQSVTVVFTTPVGGTKATNIPLNLANVVNPLPGNYNVGDITFFRTDLAGTPIASQAFASASYDIAVTPFVTLTITTPGPGQTVDFGPIDPGTPSTTADVSVEVTASGPHKITRALGGQSVEMGLTVVGNAVGQKNASSGAYTDTYQLDPPWTTPPGPYTATVQYTVTL